MPLAEPQANSLLESVDESKEHAETEFLAATEIGATRSDLSEEDFLMLTQITPNLTTPDASTPLNAIEAGKDEVMSSEHVMDYSRQLATSQQAQMRASLATHRVQTVASPRLAQASSTPRQQYSAALARHYFAMETISPQDANAQGNFESDFLSVSRTITVQEGTFKYYGFDRRPLCLNPFHFRRSGTATPAATTTSPHRLEIGKQALVTTIAGLRAAITQSPGCAIRHPLPAALFAHQDDGSVIFGRPEELSEEEWSMAASQSQVAKHWDQPGITEGLLPQSWILTAGPPLQISPSVGSHDELVWVLSTPTCRVMAAREEMKCWTEMDDADLVSAPEGASVSKEEISRRSKDFVEAWKTRYPNHHPDWIRRPETWAW